MRILYRSKVLKSIASLLLLEVGTQLLAPTVSYALTSGPTAPEATNFEPVDTTDMVDLASGDFTYSIPLLEVPGPEGGYPLALAYHAGVQPNEEASWVGLGWSLNPGAINRNVNGFADDFEGVNQQRRDFWNGGSMSTTAVGVTVGIPGTPASVSFGLSFSQDTYRGFGVGANMGVGSAFDLGPVSLGVSASVYTDGYGNVGAGVGVGLSTKIGGGVSGGIGISASTSGGFDAGASLSYSDQNKQIGTTLLGASISSTSSTPSLTAGGISATVENGNAGKIQTEVSSFGLSIPFPGGAVNLRQSDVRYWSDETVDVATNGSLYFPKQYLSTNGNPNVLDTKAFDTYRLLDPDNENVYDHPDPNWLQGGSYPDYDNYVVSAQGLGGSMRPYSYQLALYSQNSYEDTDNGKSYKIVDTPLPWTNKPAFFRFENDFSNQYQQGSTGQLVADPYTYQQGDLDGLRYNFDSQPQRGGANSLGYDANTDRLAGSKAIEYYTNHQIITGEAKNSGFIDQSAKGFARDDNSQIGGFSITNASGVTYHYALPVYSYNEVTYMEKVGSNGGTYSRLSKPAKYAYTWYLTAVTGPDYVDYDGNGLAGGTDWGYYVAFNYGQWTDNYQWRNPAQGFHRDADATFQDYSSGTKELYYLNSITTRTHTALFIKSFRADAKGLASTGISNPFSLGFSITCPPRKDIGCTSRVTFPKPQLKLDKVVILNNKDVPVNLESNSSLYRVSNINNSQLVTINREVKGNNIVDAYDFDATPALQANSVSTVAFTYNYTLCPGTTNSWDENGVSYTRASNINDFPANPALLGKLTLLQTQTFGPGGNGAMPATKFGYELSPDEKISGNIAIGQVVNSKAEVTLPADSPFKLGDLLAFSSGATRYTCALVAKSPTANAFMATFFGTPPSYSSFSATTTKNPAYSKDSYDMWGMFKSDFDTDLTGLAGHDESIARATSEISARNTDVWSLRTIRTPLGALIKLKYGSDRYRTKVISRPNMIASFGVGQAVALGNSIGKVTLGNRLVVPATSVFYPNQTIMVSGVVEMVKDRSGGLNYLGYKTVKDVLLQVTDVKNTLSASEKNVLYVKDLSNQVWQPASRSTLSTFTFGHVKLVENPALSYGGGIRVEEVAIKTPGQEKATRYNYENNELPSGVTSYEPGSYLPMNKGDYDQLLSRESYYEENKSAASTYKNQYYESLPKLLHSARIIPAPGVMYEYITVSDEIRRQGEASLSSPQKTVYQLEVLKPNMLALVGPKFTSVLHNDPYYPVAHEVRTREVALEDFTARIGRLKRRTTYDASGVKLSETVNHYLHDELNNATLATNASNGVDGYTAKLAKYGYIGIMQEVFGDSRRTRRPDLRGYDSKVVMSRRKAYPVVLTGTTTTDFKTNKSVTTENKAFDLLSGEVTTMLSIDGYGNRISSETTPAYRIYPALGPKMGANGGRNMLTQSAGNAQFKVDVDGNKTGLIAASAQTWSTTVPVVGVYPATPDNRGTQPSVWRPQATYAWLPTTTTSDGLTPLTGPDAFVDFFANSSAPSWQKTMQMTLYDVYSNALEASDVNGQYVATKKGYNSSRVLITGGPASYNEIAYTGLEDVPRTDGSLSGGISPIWRPDGASADASDASVFTDATATTGKTHTGIKSLKISPYRHGLSYSVPISSIRPNKAYRVSVWATQPTAQVYYWVDGIEQRIIGGDAQKKANGWYLLELTIPPIGAGHSAFRVGCYNSGSTDAYLDDFRFQPIDAQCTAYVYNERTGQLTDLLDNNNLFTHYQYDQSGRLVQVLRETLKYNTKLVREFAYQYGPVAPALDGVALAVVPANANHVVQATLTLPADLNGTSTIEYSPGAGVAYLATTQLNFSYTYANAGTYWFRVKVQDKAGRQRELVSKVIVP